ncbi:MAG: hypothetical protein ACYC0C_03745 [Devosia sp.]
MRLAADIGTERDTRRAGAEARSRRVAGLHKDIHRVIAGFDDARSVMAVKITKDAHALRKQLATSNRALVSTVSERLAESNRARMTERRVLAKSAKALHAELSSARKQLAVDVDAFRANLAAERTAAAEKLRVGLSDFVDQIRTETAGLLDAVKVQTTIARGAWNVEKPSKQPATHGRKTAAKGRKAG